jgi:hypothetical protein
MQISLALHTTNLTISNRTFLYTNLPLDADPGYLPDTVLIDNVMDKFRSTVENFLEPFCQIVLNNLSNGTFTSVGRLCT